MWALGLGYKNAMCSCLVLSGQTLRTQPPCCEEAHECMEKAAWGGPEVPHPIAAELLLNSQFQLANQVSEPFWQWVPRLPEELSHCCLLGPRWAVSTEPHPKCRFKSKVNDGYFFKPLSFAEVYSVSADNSYSYECRWQPTLAISV